MLNGTSDQFECRDREPVTGDDAALVSLDEVDRCCWGCGYALRGLAHGSVCPECGRTVPAVGFAGRAHDHGFAVTLVLVMMALALVGALLWSRAAPLSYGEVTTSVVVVTMLAGAVLADWWRRHRTRWKPAHTIVVTSDGIEFESWEGRRQRFPAPSIVNVAVNPSLLSARCRVRIATGRTVTVHDDLGYLPRPEAEQLAKAIRAIIERQQVASSARPSDRPDHPLP